MTAPTVYHDLHRRPFPATVVAYDTQGVAIANLTTVTIIFDNEVLDIESQYNPATGLVTARLAGHYQVHAAVQLADTAAFACGEFFRLNLEVNGGVVYRMAQIDWFSCGATNIEPALNGTAIVAVSAGDTIGVSCRQSSGAAVATSGANFANYINVTRIGPP